MAWTVYRGEAGDLERLRGRCVAIIGYGNQGRAHALNLRDSGVEVAIGQRPGASADRAGEDGFVPVAVGQAVRAAELIIMALPDETAAEVFGASIASHLENKHTLGFVHGFNIRFGFIVPPPSIDVIMIAPKGPGALLRSLFVAGRGLPALMAVHQDASGLARSTALAWAAGIGSTRAGVVETTFASETETDLFGEQAVLCGGVTALCKAGFETLVEAGYEPAFAYLECVHELKQVVDLIYERGLAGMRKAISNTAEYGDVTRGPRIMGEAVRAEMRRILDEVRSGAFAKEWIEEHRAGGDRFRKLHDSDADGDFEEAGRAIRSLMPWLGKSQ
jgi:ketol-acid reductoisomerase